MAPYQWYCVSFTACDTPFGVIRAMQARCNPVYRSDNLEGKIIAVQGPGAVGHNISNETLDRVKHKIICRTANNQLKEERHGELLEQKGIGYAPDYIAKGGGTIYDTDRSGVGVVNHERGREKVSRIY